MTDLVEDLVHQFTDPYAFYRELIQNAIDAGSNRIEVTLRYSPTPSAGVTTAQVQDWGEGMTREIVERFLLTKFRSSKEDDLTKIGKFGIGFMSVFACAPELVVVETGRDGEDLRVLLHPDRSYEILACPEPIEGTRVSVHKDMSVADYRDFVARSHDSVRRWCKHSEADVTFAAGDENGSSPGPGEPVREPLALDTAFQVEYREEGTVIVAGPSRDERQTFAGFYNRGLTLLETAEPLAPGVDFKILSRYLEHTLTRDDIRRDKGFARAMKLLGKLVEGALEDRLKVELRALAEKAEDDGTYWRTLSWASRRLDPDHLWFPLALGGAVDGRALRRSAKKHGLLYARRAPSDPLLLALAGEGALVLRHDDWTLKIAEQVTKSKRALAHEGHTVASPGQGASTDVETVLAAAVGALLAAAGARTRTTMMADVCGAGFLQPAVLVDAAGEPTASKRSVSSPFKRGCPEVLCLNRAHARITAALRLSAKSKELAALLVARGLASSWAALDDRADHRLTEAALSQ
ncbi:MAG: ATP-binding protein [Deltaproteobacteria bacterium]|nr:ATP-binding protein [Deltaproteobacteria bacterium]